MADRKSVAALPRAAAVAAVAAVAMVGLVRWSPEPAPQGFVQADATQTLQAAIIGTLTADLAECRARDWAASEAAWYWYERYLECANGTPTPDAPAPAAVPTEPVR